MHLNNNRLSGTIPDILYEMTELETLNLAKNKLSGVISFRDIMKLSHLQFLSLASNKFSGSILEEEEEEEEEEEDLESFDSLKELYLNQNEFTGTISSSSSSHMKKLKALSIEGNFITGIMPNTICNLRKENLILLSADCSNDAHGVGVTCNCCTECYSD